jgi:replicative superfamily II helicase
MALLYGNFITLIADQKSYVYMRQYFDQAAIIIFNKNNTAQNISTGLPGWINTENLQAEFGNSFSINDRNLEIRLEPWSFEILTGK